MHFEQTFWNRIFETNFLIQVKHVLECVFRNEFFFMFRLQWWWWKWTV